MMKSSLSKAFYVLVLLLVFSSTPLSALELARDTFTNNNNSWTGGSVSSNTYLITRDTTATKTYNFGVSYANQNVTINLQAICEGGWEASGGSKDTLNITANSTVFSQSYTDNTYNFPTITKALDGNGRLILSVNPNTTGNGENVRIDNVVIATIENVAPVVTNATFSIADNASNGTSVGSVVATDANGDILTYSITAGNTGNTFAINASSGLITVATSTNLNHNTTPSYTLTVQASDGSLSSTGTITINIIAPVATVNVGQRNFALRNPITTRNIKGGLKVIGNTVLCVKNNGVCYDYTGGSSNSELDLQYIDIDGVNRTYNNSSQAELSIPSTATVKWVGVYTQGYINNNNSTTVGNIIKEAIYLTVPSVTGTIALAPEVIDLYANDTDGYTYDTYASVASLVGKKGSEINGWITGANIKADTGTEGSGLGNFGAWTVVVVYEDANESLKNISVFDGYKRVANADGFRSVDITTTGFLTPTSGTVKSTVSIFAGEGDKNIAGDKLYVDGVAINETNAFYSITSGFNANPNYSNKQGIDIQNHQIGVDGNATHPQIIGNNKQSATITLTSTQDTYFPSVVAFTTDLYEPRVCYVESYFDTSGNVLTNPTLGDTIIVKAWLANMKKDASDGNLEVAQKVEITVELDDTNLKYKPDTITIKNIGESVDGNKTDAKDSDIADFFSDKNTTVWRIGTGANATNGGDLQPNVTNDTTNRVYVSFKTELLTAGNINIANLYKVSYENSSMGLRIGDESPVNIGICTDFNTSITVNPPLGAFNVVNENFSGSTDPLDAKNSQNALYTQISGQQFSVKLLALNTDFMTLKPYTGDVNLSIITSPSYQVTDSDAQKQAKCDAAASLNTPQAITFANESSKNLALTFGGAYSNISFKMTYSDYGTTKNVCSRDNFAIRPATYDINTGGVTPLIGGRDYTLNINTNTGGYNQSIVANTADRNATLRLHNPVGCGLPTSDIALTLPITFPVLSGNVALTPFTYNNVGDVEVTITDNDWTMVDQNSYNAKGYDDCIVESASNAPVLGKVGCLLSKTQPFVFIPKEFRNNLVVQNFNDSAFTYTSNDGNMSATALLTTTAILDDNTTATNYTAGCFAQNISYTASLINNPINWLNGIPNAITRIRYFDDGDVSSHFESNATVGSATLSSSEGNFTNGIASNLAVKFNITRAINQADEPFRIANNDFNITTTDSNGISGSDFNRTTVQNATFYYGRVHAPDNTIDGNFANDVRIYYEAYCRTCNPTTLDINGSTSVDSINWFNNILHTPAHTQLVDGNYTATSGTVPSGSGALSVDLTAPKVPHKDKIQMHAPSWLLQNLFSATATTNDFLVEFTKGATNWAGQGTLGRTIDDTNTSVAKKSNKRIEW